VVSADPANWTPHVLDGKVDAIVVVGNKMVAGGLFTKVATADDPATPIARSNIFAFDATSGVIDMAFAPVMDGEVESLAVAPDGLHVFAGGRFAKINGVAQKSLAKLRLSDGARIAQFKGKTNAPCSPPEPPLADGWLVSCRPSAPVAQGTEQLSPKQQVAGSSPARGAKNCRSEAIHSLFCLRAAEDAFDRLNPGFGVPADHSDPLGRQAVRDREAALSLGTRVAVAASRENDRDPVVWLAGQDYRAANAVRRARTHPAPHRQGPVRAGAER
jgi:hypothetical protein